MFDFYTANTASASSTSRDHIWPGQPGYPTYGGDSVNTPTKRKASRAGVDSESPSKKVHFSPAIAVQRGNQSDKDAPPYSILLPAITITSIEMLT
jgi:hypothetical protein